MQLDRTERSDKLGICMKVGVGVVFGLATNLEHSRRLQLEERVNLTIHARHTNHVGLS